MLKKMQNILPQLEVSKYPELSGISAEDIKIIQKAITSEIVWKDLNIISAGDKEIILEENFKVESFYLREVFFDAIKVTVGCVTLGKGIPQLINDKMSSGKYYLAALADSYASQYVELLAEKWFEMRKQEQRSRGLFPTLRFSPGYGDFELKYQKEIIHLLEMEDKINVTDSFLLEPEKTITFLMGWCKEPQKNIYPELATNACPGGGNCAYCRTKACLKM